MIEVSTLSRGVLTAAEQNVYERALRQDRAISTRISLMDSNEKHVVQLLNPKSPISFLGGQVDVDTTASGPWRTIHLALLDPKKKLHVTELGADAPSDYPLWADSFIHVERGDWISAWGEFAWVSVFTGPLATFSRSGVEVEITALGKEALLLDPYLTTRSLVVPKNRLVSAAISDLVTPMGEAGSNQSLGNGSTRTHTRLTVPRLKEVWPEARKLAHTAGPTKCLFYDGKGRLKLVDRSSQASSSKVWNFNTGENGCLLSVPDVTVDFTTFRNMADVTGAAPTKNHPQPHAAEVTAAGEGLSPKSLARNGKDRYAIVVVNDSQIGTQAKAVTQAKEKLADVKDIGWDAQFDALPIPHLEEKDWVWVADENGGQFPIQMNKWSIPLGGDSMPVGLHREGGYTRNLKPKRVSRAHYHKPTKHKSKKK